MSERTTSGGWWMSLLLLWTNALLYPGGGVLRGVASFAPLAVEPVLPWNKDPRQQHRHRQRKRATKVCRATADDNEATKIGSRYLCLLQDYETVRGPYFFALWDQLFEQTGHTHKRVAFLTTQSDLENFSNGEESSSDPTTTTPLGSLLDTMESSLDLDGPPEVFVLDEWNPLALEERFSPSNSSSHNLPTIVWLYGTHNAFWTRHLLRTSGFDRWIQERCALSSCNTNTGGSDSMLLRDNCIFVGEGTGACCVGSTMDAAKARGDDPKGAPELQFYGLQLLGSRNGDNPPTTHTEGVVFVEAEDENLGSNHQYPGIAVCRRDEVFVWAQPPKDGAEEQVATQFVMAPNRRGTIEGYTTLDPLPPLIVRESNNTPNEEGVACWGEPSVDPSRSAQAGTIGDSEWWE